MKRNKVQKFTQAIVDKLPLPTEKKKQVFHWEKSLAGFGLRCTPSGKTYVVQGRVKGSTIRYSIGKHGEIKTEAARKEALSILAEMAEEKDPRKTQSTAAKITLRDWAEDYIAHKVIRNSGLPLKESSKNDIKKHLDGIFKKWADRPIADITRDKVIILYRNHCKKSKAQASQAFRVLRAVYNWTIEKSTDADGHATIPPNPVAALKNEWRTPPPREVKIPLDKIGIAWNCLKTLRASHLAATRNGAALLSFIMLTGARFSEAATLKWEQVEDNCWRIPDPKNRRPVILPLSCLAASIVHGQPKNNEYVFPGRSAGHIKDSRGVLEKLSKDVGHRITNHDLRRTFSAVAKAAGLSFFDRKLLLNHVIAGDVTSEHYDDNDLRSMSPASEKITAFITRQASLAAKGNVVDLSTRRVTK